MSSFAQRHVGWHSLGPDYRLDIQGLRGLAVVFVVLYHVGYPLPGGFTGVDIFFVISGYVITRLVLDNYSLAHHFSFKEFYSRRISRLMPLCALVTVVTVVVAHFRLSPFGEVQDVVSTGKWSIVFLANHQLLGVETYVGLESNPLRHLWSLAVEMQFYLAYPILLVSLLRLRSRGIRGEDRAAFLFVFFFLTSFAMCLYLSHFGGSISQRVSFFAAPTRAWQFLLGSAAVLYFEPRVSRDSSARRIVGFASVIGLVWSALVLVESSTYPGVWAILPTLSTFGILISSSPGSLLHRILTVWPLRFIGDLSYGLYLWHWPIVVYVERSHTMSLGYKIAVICVSLLLALASYSVIENPIRRSFRSPRRAVIILGLSISLLTAGVVVVGGSANRVYLRALSPTIEADAQLVRFGLGARDTILDFVDACSNPETPLVELEKVCTNSVNRDATRILLLGDSHAAALGDGLILAGDELGMSVMGFFEYGCPFIDGYAAQRIDDCVKSIEKSTALVREWKPDIVVIAQSYSAYATFEQEATSIVDVDPGIPFSQEVRTRVFGLVSDALVKIKELTEMGTKTILVREVPFAIMPGTSTKEEFLAHSRLLDLVNEEIDRQLIPNPRLTVLDPTSDVCPIGPPCALDNEGHLLYWHKTHLNRRGSERLKSFWIRSLEEVSRSGN